jgi:hypothetical protein
MMYQMAVIYTNIFHSTQFGIFGLKLYHLTALVHRRFLELGLSCLSHNFSFDQFQNYLQCKIFDYTVVDSFILPGTLDRSKFVLVRRLILRSKVHFYLLKTIENGIVK